MRIFRQAFESIGGGTRSRNRSIENDGGSTDGARTTSIGPTFHVDKKYQTPDFLFQQSPKSKFQEVSTSQSKIRTAALSKNFFSMLSSLEDKLLLQRHRSLELIDTLVNMYKQCVEVYDSLQDPIKYYFVDKIQSALADAETWNIINKTEDKTIQSNIIKKKSSEQDSEEIFHDIEETVSQFHRNIEANIIQRNEKYALKEEKLASNSKRGSIIELRATSPHQDLVEEEDQMRINQRARSKKVTIIQKVHAETEQSSENMSNMMTHYQHDVQKTDSMIKDSLQVQENSLQDRLKKRGSRQSVQRKMGHSNTTSILETASKGLEQFFMDNRGNPQ